MSEAVVLHETFKKFGPVQPPVWMRSSRRMKVNGAINGQPNNHTVAQPPAVVAVDHVSFTVHQGEIFGLLGPSGSGKSTLIRLLATLLLPDAGDIRVFGYDAVTQPTQVQRLINRVSVEASFFRKLSPMENLVYGARLYGMSGGETRSEVVEILTRLGLDQRSIHRPMDEMSRNTQQKVVIARALLSHPRLLLLDDPMKGLDPQARQEVQTMIRELRDRHGTTVLLTTPDWTDAEAVCDRIAVLQDGRLLALDTPEGLKHLAWHCECAGVHVPVFQETAGLSYCQSNCDLAHSFLPGTLLETEACQACVAA